MAALAPTPAGAFMLAAALIAAASALGVPLLPASSARAAAFGAVLLLALGLYLDIEQSAPISGAGPGIRCFLFSLGVDAAFLAGLAAVSLGAWRRFGAPVL